MKLLLLLVAELVIHDGRTNKITAINLIEEFSSATFPAILVSPYVSVTFQKEEGDPSEREGYLVFKMGENEIGRSSFIIDFGALLRSRTVIELNGIIIPEPGHVNVQVLLDEDLLGDWDILVSQLSEEH